MGHFYCNDKATQMLLVLLKENKIKRIVASPGTGNMPFVASVQQDSFFEVYSCVDERSAAYMACGMVWESGEPVVLSCTGATASRNYFSALTEAFYRKLPILVVTASQRSCNEGQLITQYINRTLQPTDTVCLSVQIPAIKDTEDIWDCNVKLNRCVLELFRQRQPVHINMEGRYDLKFDVKTIPATRVIKRFYQGNAFPVLPKSKRIAFVVGAHVPFDKELTEIMDAFCQRYNSVVFCDHTSGYYGQYRVLASIAAAQEYYNSPIFDNIDILIHMGEQLGDLYLFNVLKKVKEVWRVHFDGELRDTYRKLKYVFQMNEKEFLLSYCKDDCGQKQKNSYLEWCKSEVKSIIENIPPLPLSNIWVAQKASLRLPQNAVIYFSILNTLRSWNFFELKNHNTSFSNVGGFGIDGGISTLLGASQIHKNKLYYCVAGDLQFFYDMNACGNRHVGNNVRILLINNGKGSEFRLYTHGAQQMLQEDADKYIAASGHFGNQSAKLVKNYMEALGFLYLSAHTKEEFKESSTTFFDENIGEQPIIFEVFTNSDLESEALKRMRNIKKDIGNMLKNETKAKVKKVVKAGMENVGVKVSRPLK